MKTVGKATDLITFSRSSGGTALRKIGYGPELVTNGTFDTDTSGWVTTSGSLASVSGRGELTNSGAVSALSSSSFNTVAGKVYQVFAEVENTTALSNCRIYVGTTSGGINLLTINTPNGDTNLQTVAGVFVATGSTTYVSVSNRAINNAVAYYDNISVKEVLFDQGDLTLFNHPADIPRVEYDAAGNVLGLLVEESRTNLVTTSALPPLLGATRDTADNITSPTQELNGGLVVEDTSLNAHGIRQTSVLPTAGAATYTVSVFAKAKERSFLRMQMYGDAVAHTLEGWDLTAGTAPSGGTIQDCGNGWYRCSGTFTVANTTGGFNYASVYLGESSGSYYYTGDGSSGAYMFGFQLEAGAFPTSYIPTSGSTATRAADVASIATSEFGFNQEKGTLMVEGSRPYSMNTSEAYASLAESYINRFTLYIQGLSNYVNGYTRNQAGANTLTGPVANIGGFDRWGMTYDDKDGFVFAVNGVEKSTAAAANGDFEGKTALHIGNAYGGGSEIPNGHIKSIKYIPRRLTNDQLVELTS